jgi:protein tyrosine phosphatase domain-containing protein 1
MECGHPGNHLVEQGKNVAVHCHAGIGRTGIFLACMAQDYLGMSPDESISWIRQYIPGAVETLYQMKFVRDYPKHKKT